LTRIDSSTVGVPMLGRVANNRKNKGTRLGWSYRHNNQPRREKEKRYTPRGEKTLQDVTSQERERGESEKMNKGSRLGHKKKV